MLKMLKKTIAFVCIFALMVPVVGVSAADDELLYEKYDYQEKFSYEDEMIGHVVKTAVAKIFLDYSVTIKYSPIIFDAEKFKMLYTTLYEEGYSSESILAVLIEDVQNDLSSYLSYAQEKEVSTSGTFVGSGVVISDNGYIATNSHVAALTEEDKKQMYLSHMESEVIDDISAVIEDVEGIGVVLSDDQIIYLYDMIMNDASQKADIIDEETELTVCFPTAKGSTKYNKATKYEAEIVAEGTQEGMASLTQDTAILKIDAKNLVALKLSDSYPELNSKIVSAGFPAASDRAFQEVGSTESVLSVTVGTGQIARLIPVEDSDYQAIEITTTISGGNSGGPSLDTGLNIEGLNTYTLSEDQRYAYMVPAEYVSELASRFDIEQGEASKTFLLGIQMLQQGYGLTALECFERVKELQPDTPFIENLIELAKEAPENEAPEKSPKQEAKKEISKIVLIIIFAGAAVVLLLAIIIVVIIAVLSKKKRERIKAEATVTVAVDTEAKTIRIPQPTAGDTIRVPVENKSSEEE